MDWKGIRKVVCDYVFPVFCLQCRREGLILCVPCRKSLKADGVFVCPVCRVPRPEGNTCSACGVSSSLTQLISLAVYNPGEPFGQLIEMWKYHMVEEVERFWETMCGEFVHRHGTALLTCDMIVPVPLHRRRYAERGFNQSERLAILLSSLLDVPDACLLRRGRYNRKPARLSQQHRKENVSNAFVVKQTNPDFHGKNILIVDDVFTSGATMQECARVLVAAGAKTVSGFTLARRM